MSDLSKDTQLALFRKLQLFAPAAMVIIAALIFWLWKDESSPLVAGVIAFTAIPDFFVFKFIADGIESGRINLKRQ